jgi:hypothetical protein
MKGRSEMSDDDNDLEDTSVEGDGIANLRKQLKELKKRDAERETELVKFRAEQRAGSVAEILKAKNIPASAAKLYTGEDTSPDAVGKWLEDFADVFNIKPADPATDANAEAAKRVSDASYGSEQSTQKLSEGVVGDLDEIQRLIDTQPYDELVKMGLMPARR